MASVPNSVETLPKISVAWVGRTNVTDRRQTTDGRTTTYSEREREFTFAKNWRHFIRILSTNTRLVASYICHVIHWTLTDGLLYTVEQRRSWVGCTPIHDITGSTKCNKPIIRNQCIGVHISLCNVEIHCSRHLSVHKGIDIYACVPTTSWCVDMPCALSKRSSRSQLLVLDLTAVEINSDMLQFSPSLLCVCVCWPMHACMGIARPLQEIHFGVCFLTSLPFPSFPLSSFFFSFF